VLAAIAWWPLAAIADVAPALLAGALLVDIVLVVGLTTAWYALVDLRTQPLPPRPSPPPATAVEATGPGCVLEAAIEFGAWILLGVLALLSAWGWARSPAATIGVWVVIGVVVIGSGVRADRRRRRAGGPRDPVAPGNPRSSDE